MKINVKLAWCGHKNDNGPGSYNYKVLHIAQVEWNGIKFNIGPEYINMYGYPITMEGSSVSVHGGASLQVTKEPSPPPPCRNPVPRGIAMNMNRRGEWNSSAMGQWDGEGVVDIDENILLLLPVAVRIEQRLGSTQIGKPTVGIRYPRRGRYPYITCNVSFNQNAESYQKESQWVQGVIAEEMATFKWPEIQKRAPKVYPEIGEVPGEVADVIDMSGGRELRRALDGKGGGAINQWLESLSEQDFERVVALVGD